MPETKTNKRRCAKCLKKKSLDQFKLHAGRRGRKKYGYCYDCEIGYLRTYNANRYASPEARQAELERTKAKYHRLVKPQRLARKIKLIRLMGGKCEICGYAKSAAALDFDHIDPTTKSRTISHLLAQQEPEAFELAVVEAKKCKLLCSNCHREKTYPGFELDSIP